MLCEVVSVVIIHPAPTDCTSPPRLDTSVASHSMRKVSCRKGASMEGRSDMVRPNGNTDKGTTSPLYPNNSGSQAANAVAHTFRREIRLESTFCPAQIARASHPAPQ